MSKYDCKIKIYINTSTAVLILLVGSPPSGHPAPPGMTHDPNQT